eukprot:11323254-Ditylum_brightwellii.AAC.1
MVEHYFQCALNKEQIARLTMAIDGDFGMPSSKPHLKLTPAQVEQLAAEFDDIEDMITAVENKSSLIPKKPVDSATCIVYDA